MFELLLPTKLYLPPAPAGWVPRPRLLQQLTPTRLIVIAAPAGYGKTTLATAWLHQQAENDSHICWLSLEEEESDPRQFFRYLLAAVEDLPNLGTSLRQCLQAGQPLPAKTLMKAFVHDATAVDTPFILALDDYHTLDSPEIDAALTLLLDHMPPHMTLLLTSRSDPNFPIARLRARGQLCEIRAADLRFTEDEASQFLQNRMGLDLSAEQIAALEQRTEGWIAGLQMAALSLQNQAERDRDDFVRHFTGSHRFILDYLLEEVLNQQPPHIQTFLLRTAILERLCGSLCDAVLGNTAVDSRDILAQLAQANLFLIPLDEERRWYRYHHLFADLLRQRAATQAEGADLVTEAHRRASAWYEAHGFAVEALHHATAVQDIPRATRLIQGEGDGLPLHFRGAVLPVLKWFESLPTAVLDQQPDLWITYASALLFAGQNSTVAEKLDAAEIALQRAQPDNRRERTGRIAAMRATLAVVTQNGAQIRAYAEEALAHLPPENISDRTAALWTLGFAHQITGNRPAAQAAYEAVLATGQRVGQSIYTIAAATSLGQVHEADLQLTQAEASYQQAIALAGEPPQPTACEAHLGLARIYYARARSQDEHTAVLSHAQIAHQLAQQIESGNTLIDHGLLRVQLASAEGDAAEAMRWLDETERLVRQYRLDFRTADVVAERVRLLWQQGNMAAIPALVGASASPLLRARAELARERPRAALALLLPEGNNMADARAELARLLLVGMAQFALEERDTAVATLQKAVSLAQPQALIRPFVDEGTAVAPLLYEAASNPYVRHLLAAFPATTLPATTPILTEHDDLLEPLSEREVEVLALIAQGLTNQEVANRLYLSLHTIKVHARNIYGKLGVKNRTQAVAKGRLLGLLPPL